MLLVVLTNISLIETQDGKSTRSIDSTHPVFSVLSTHYPGSRYFRVVLVRNSGSEYLPGTFSFLFIFQHTCQGLNRSRIQLFTNCKFLTNAILPGQPRLPHHRHELQDNHLSPSYFPHTLCRLSFCTWASQAIPDRN